nr:TonB-dependent receptor [Bacteroidota bacterium]
MPKKITVQFNTVLVILIGLFLPVMAYSQETVEVSDTIKRITIDEVVITANRYENKILNTGASIDVIQQRKIQELPVMKLSNTLKFLPGVYMSSSDGMGLNPQITLRGFYGGGEAEYLSVLVDGMQINDLQNGLVSWNMIPLNQVGKLELLRGGSSPLYGDAAMGGVMNIITEKYDKPLTSATIGYGSFNTYNIGFDHMGKVGNGNYEIYANNDHTDGFRDHSKWNSITFGGKIKLPVGKNSTIAFSSFNQILDSEDPGFLTSLNIQDDRSQSLSLFRNDGKDYKKFIFRADFNTKVSDYTDLGVNLNFQYNDADNTRTYAQYPTILNATVPDPFPIGVYDTTMFGDTKKRELSTTQAGLGIKVLSMIPEIDAKITGGIEVEYGRYDNSIYDRFRGFEEDYNHAYLPKDLLDTKGDGYRFKSAAYLGGEVPLLQPLILLIGIRYDLISDEFDASVPDTSINKTNSAFSPKIALNLSTGETDNYTGSIFISWSQSFKAPTIDQRTDMKTLNYMVYMYTGSSTLGPYLYKADPFSNADLDPQRSTNFELGTYQFYKFSENFSGEINLTGYFTKVMDEIDFDLQSQQYKNIQDSEHQGLETYMRLNYMQKWSGFFNLNYTEVKFASGDYNGNFLKGIPKTSYAFGVSYDAQSGLGGTLVYNGAGGIYLDDENTTKMDAYGVFSARINYRLKFANIYLDIENIFDNSYNSTGYMLSGVEYLYPAIGRFITGGINFNF